MAIESSRYAIAKASLGERMSSRRQAPQSGSDVHESASSGFAFGLFIFFIIFTLLSVPSRLPMLGMMRPTVLLVALISTVIIFVTGIKKDRDASRTTGLLMLFILYVVVSIPFVQWPGSVVRFGIEGFVKVAVFFFFAVQLVDTYRRLWLFVMTILACQVFRVLEPLYLHLTTGYWGSQAHMSSGEFMNRLGGAPSDIINPNGLAFVVLTALPFLHYLLGGSSRALPKLAYAVLGALLLYTFMLTGSRSGMVGLVVLVGIIIFRSRHRVLLGSVAAVCAMVMVANMSGEMKDRYMSLVSSGTQHGSTADGRIEGMKTEFSLGLRRPIFGHGLGTSAEAKANVLGHDQIAHNLYTEVFIETGAIGFALFMAILASIVKNARAVPPALKRLSGALADRQEGAVQARLHFFQRCADATLAWVVMCLVFSMASYGLSEFYWYMIAGLSVCLVNVVALEERMLSGAAFHVSSDGDR